MRITKKQHELFIIAMFLQRVDLTNIGHTDLFSIAGLPEKSRKS